MTHDLPDAIVNEHLLSWVGFAPLHNSELNLPWLIDKVLACPQNYITILFYLKKY